MIISHSRHFVFARGIRNAGTTVKAALSTLCNDDDRIAAYNPAEIPILQKAGYRTEQHNTARNGRTLIPYRSHWDLDDLYKTYPTLADFDVIGICRNPYDKAYSFGKWALMRMRYNAGLEPVPATPGRICTFMMGWITKRYFKEDAITSHRNVYNDKTTGNVTLIRYENLEADLKKVFDHYGAPMPELFRFKDSSKVCSLPWQEVLTRKEIDFINKLMEKDFEIFGYEML
ncbi:hypothetical protein [Oxalobacter paraformigenes]|uniref:Sulfotransferase family protein n=1 Tax=Oxalobacter paraformigenes TaxID=556268 RepID=C3X342_9BURK|nr:hypothetical protein [Oxalobacter paraformigenes]EEO27628.1 hypothetical protein OFAG_00781 [Oxalobacter paraformigenes]